MIKFKILILISLFPLLQLPVLAQNNDDFFLATRLMQQQRFEEARPILEELAKESPDNYMFTSWLIDCYIQLKKYDDGVSAINHFLNNPQYKNEATIRLAELYHFKGEKEKAIGIWYENIKKASGQLQLYINTASVMIERREYLEAVKVYKMARETFQNNRLFFGDIANAYMRAGEYELAIEEWLNLIEDNPNQLSFVQRNLLRYNDSILYDITIMELEERIDNLQPESPVYQTYFQLQIWLLQENKLYRRALAAAKAFEQSSPSFNYVLFNVGRQLSANSEFELAVEAFSYYVENANGEVRWRNMEELASTYSLWAKYLDDFNLDFQNNRDSLYALSLELLDEIIKETTYYSRLHQVYLKKAKLSLDYLFNLNKAEDAFSKLQSMPNMQDSPELHFLEGRIRMAKNEFTLARLSLTKANKSANIGELAEKSRYFLALNDFFSGDYEFATIQLKSLGRQNTSYHANDALKLRLWIQKGLHADSTGAMLDVFAEAVFNFMNGNSGKSTVQFQEMLHQDLFVALKDNVILFLLDSKHLDDGEKYKELTAFLGSGMQTPIKERLLWEQAILTERIQKKCADLNTCLSGYSGEIKSAREIYEDLILSYPQGFYAPYARERLKNLETNS